MPCQMKNRLYNTVKQGWHKHRTDADKQFWSTIFTGKIIIWASLLYLFCIIVTFLFMIHIKCCLLVPIILSWKKWVSRIDKKFSTELLSVISLYRIQLMSHVMRKPVYVICEQQRCRSACASTQSDQHLFAVRCLDSIVSLVSISKISRI